MDFFYENDFLIDVLFYFIYDILINMSDNAN
ncbi:Uncharacterised protein [Elizabethkingia miricola]|nr:Uncharacterised protein [Elizabethkingia miricola]